MGLFGFGKGKSGGAYGRRQADTPPDGWVEAQALIETSDAQETKLKVGSGSGNNKARVYRTTTTYVVLDQDGAPLPIVVEAKLRRGEVPEQGAWVTVAYDPADPTDVVVLLAEAEHAARFVEDARQAVENGNEAPCEIVAAAPTGRVSRPEGGMTAYGRSAPIGHQLDPAPELLATLAVTPPGAPPFEVSRTVWDRGLGLAPGMHGTLFFLPDDPARGFPVFPREHHRAAGGDPLALAREEFVRGLETTTVKQGRVTYTRMPARLDG